jgi:hypothetical protein
MPVALAGGPVRLAPVRSLRKAPANLNPQGDFR